MYEQNVHEDLADAHISDLASFRRPSSCDVPSIRISSVETPKRASKRKMKRVIELKHETLERKQNKKQKNKKGSGSGTWRKSLNHITISGKPSVCTYAPMHASTHPRRVP